VAKEKTEVDPKDIVNQDVEAMGATRFSLYT
jgi:hypothetical protein